MQLLGGEQRQLLFAALTTTSVALTTLVGCESCNSLDEPGATKPKDADPGRSLGAPPVRLDLPPRFGAGGATGNVDIDDLSVAETASERRAGSGACPPEMVLVAASLCIDRYEAHLVDARQLRALSPNYPPSRRRSRELFDLYARRAPNSRGRLGRLLDVPAPPTFELDEDVSPLARSEAGIQPAGYLNYPTAKLSCEAAGKRLCRREEWVRACRGEDDQPFPYGPSFQDRACNVHRSSHPAALLHGDTSEGHHDPRLNLVTDSDGPLLRPTGGTPTCKSTWGGDAIFDMVGNLDEWIDDPAGTFVGGFYSRATRAGCEAAIEVHAPEYFDYSLGVRCCLDAR